MSVRLVAPAGDVAPAAPTPVDDWLAAAQDALREVGATALGCADMSSYAASPSSLASSVGLGGAYVQVMSEREVVVVGLCAAAPALAALSGALLGCAGADVSPADVTDAVGEVANMLAGGVKRRLSPARPGLQLGLPMFIRGHLEPRERQALRVVEVRLSPDIAVVVVVLYEPRAS